MISRNEKRQDYGSDYGSNYNANDNGDNATSTTPIPKNKNYVLIHFGVVLAVIVLAIVICIVIFIYRRKLQQALKSGSEKKRIDQITHLKNADNGEYNSLDYYSNEYIADNKIIHPDPELSKSLPEPPDTGSSISKGNRNYKIYARSDTVNNDVSRSNTIKSIKSESAGSVRSVNTKVDRINILVTRNNTTDNVPIGVNRISSPVSSPSASIYNNEKANLIASNLVRSTARHIPPVPPVSLSNYKQPKEILRESQMTSISNARSFEDLTRKHSSKVNSTATTNGPPIISQDVSMDLSEALSLPPNKSDRKAKISFSSRLKKNSSERVPRIDIDRFSSFKVSSADLTISESPEEIKNETTKKEDLEYDDISLGKSYLRLSRESNIFKKTLYRIT